MLCLWSRRRCAAVSRGPDGTISENPTRARHAHAVHAPRSVQRCGRAARGALAGTGDARWLHASRVHACDRACACVRMRMCVRACACVCAASKRLSMNAKSSLTHSRVEHACATRLRAAEILTCTGSVRVWFTSISCRGSYLSTTLFLTGFDKVDEHQRQRQKNGKALE